MYEMPTKLTKHLPGNNDGFLIAINFENINEVTTQSKFFKMEEFPE